jgi:Bacterial dnaA protein helix-turn-helix
MSDLGGHYHEVRQRLRNGYGSDIPDVPIVTPKHHQKNPLEALTRQIKELQSRLAAVESELANRRPKTLPLSPCEKIIRAIAKNEGITKLELLSHRKGHVVIHMRHIGFYLCATMTGESLPTIGKAWNRDHTAIMHGRDKIARQRKVKEDLDKLLTWYELDLVNNKDIVSCSVPSA